MQSNNHLAQSNIMLSDKMLKNMPHNIDGKIKNVRRMRNIAICMLPIIFISIPLSIIILGSLPLMFTMLLLFACCMPTIMVSLLKVVQYSAIIRIRDQILLYDKVSIDELASPTFKNIQVVQLVTQLISSGNLTGYELIDNKMIVKEGVSYSEYSASIKEPFASSEGYSAQAVSLQDIVYCKSCGNKMTKTDNFCSKCGNNLK